MPTTSPTAERILVVGNGFLGDTVLGVPFLRNLRRAFPGAVIEMLNEPRASTVIAGCPYVDEFLAWPRTPRPPRLWPPVLERVAARAEWLAGRGYARAYLFKRSFSSALVVRLAGIPCRVGHAAEGRGWLLSRSVNLRQGRHQAESYLDLLRCEGIAVDDARNENWVADPDRAAADSLVAAAPAGRQRVFLAVRSTNPAKDWPPDRWARVVERLVGEHGCEIFFCGAPADGEVHAEILRRLEPRVARHVHDHSAALKLRQVGALLARMDLCLGVDSGLPHIAASHGVPVAVLFGPSDPAQWHPWQTASEVVRGPNVPPAGGSMLDIDVDRVVAAAERLLARPPAGVPPVAATATPAQLV
jgi:heptosyltransferase-2